MNRSRIIVITGLMLGVVMIHVACAQIPPQAEEKEGQSIFWLNPYGLENRTKTAKFALEARYGKDWHKKYQIGWHYKYPSIPFDHWFIRIVPPHFCLLATSKKVYLLSPIDFNKFLKSYGSNVKLETNRDIIHLFEVYLRLFGLYSYGVSDEEIFTEKHLRIWTEEAKEKYSANPREFTHLDVKKENSYFLLDCYTITRVSSYTRIPSPQDIIISHYAIKVENKGEIYLNLINRTKYEQVIPAGPR